MSRNLFWRVWAILLHLDFTPLPFYQLPYDRSSLLSCNFKFFSFSLLCLSEKKMTSHFFLFYEMYLSGLIDQLTIRSNWYVIQISSYYHQIFTNLNKVFTERQLARYSFFRLYFLDWRWSLFLKQLWLSQQYHQSRIKL
jgi:hypothetical protein